MSTFMTGALSELSAEVNHNGASNATVFIDIPVRCRIADIVVDVITAVGTATAYTVATSGPVTIAATALTIAGGRSTPAYTAANLTSMGDVAAGSRLTFTFVPTGTASAGRFRASVRLSQIA